MKTPEHDGLPPHLRPQPQRGGTTNPESGANAEPPPSTCASIAAATRETFPEGGLAWLKSGGPALTVIGAGCCEVEVVWFDAAELRRETFHPACLVSQDPNMEFPF